MAPLHIIKLNKEQEKKIKKQQYNQKYYYKKKSLSNKPQMVMFPPCQHTPAFRYTHPIGNVEAIVRDTVIMRSLEVSLATTCIFTVSSYQKGGIKEYKGYYGDFPLPEEWSKEKYEETYKYFMSVSSKKKSSHYNSAPNFLGGSTCGPTRHKYLKKIDSKVIILPRLTKKYHPGTKGFALMCDTKTIQMAIYAEKLTIQWAKLHNPTLIPILEHAKHVIPAELRYGNTFWTALTLVDDLEDGQNHEHKDSKDVVSLIIMVGDNIRGGETLYFNGGCNFNMKNIKETRGGLENVVNFKHGRYQVCDFSQIVHSGSSWKGKRGIISFYLNSDILSHFQVFGDQHYYAERDKMYA